MDVILKEGIDLLNEIGAKQSTSEEILEKVDGLAPSAGERFVVHSNPSLTDTFTTPFSITGKGTLEGLLVSGYLSGNTPLIVTITVDGVPYVYSMQGTSGGDAGYQVYFILSNGSDIGFSSAGTSQHRIDYRGYVVSASTTTLYQLSEGTLFSVGVNTSSAIFIGSMKDNIPFNNSLSISVSQSKTGTGTECRIWYTLQE